MKIRQVMEELQIRNMMSDKQIMLSYIKKNPTFICTMGARKLPVCLYTRVVIEQNDQLLLLIHMLHISTLRQTVYIYHCLLLVSHIVHEYINTDNSYPCLLLASHTAHEYKNADKLSHYLLMVSHGSLSQGLISLAL